MKFETVTFAMFTFKHSAEKVFYDPIHWFH